MSALCMKPTLYFIFGVSVNIEIDVVESDENVLIDKKVLPERSLELSCSAVMRNPGQSVVYRTIDESFPFVIEKAQPSSYKILRITMYK